MTKVKTVAIYCASSSKVPNEFLLQTSELVQHLVSGNIHIYYGGGYVGLMGQVAKTTLSLDGEITGVIPQFMIEQGWNNPEVNQIIVQDMHERKKVLVQSSDATIILPGGFGTLDEAFEVIALKQLGQYSGPIIFANFNNFFTPLLKFNDTLIENGVIREEHLQLFKVINSPKEIIKAINGLDSGTSDYLNIAQI